MEEKMIDTKWDKRFQDLAWVISQWSKDPSTKCGAVIVRPDRTIASLGYNGFPRGIEDKQELYDNREEKYKRVIHGEMNALLNAREPLHGYTMYIYPGPCSCERCTVHIIQAGIKRVVAANGTPSHAKRWADSYDLSRQLYKEAGVELVLL
jgi:dCMP deaminase